MQTAHNSINTATIRRTTELPFLWLTVVLFMVAPKPGMADESDIRAEAKRHFEAGLTLTKMEKFEDAAHEFEASISLHPTASALFNLANCYKVSHHYDDALSAFSKMRIDYKEELSPEIHRAIERHVKEILSLVAEIHIAVTPHGATIRLDGRIIGTSPLDKNVRVDPGKRQVQVSLDGYQTEHREIDLLAKETSSLSFDLKRSRAKLFISSNVDDATVFVDGQEVGYTPLSDPLLLEPGNYAVRLDKTGYAAGERDVDLTAENQRFLNLILMPTASGVESKPALSLWSWLGVGLTVATAATGGTFFYLADKRHDDFNKAKSKIEDKTALWSDKEKTRLLSDQQSASDDVRKYMGWGWGIGSSACALLVTTVIFISHDLKGSRDEPEKVVFTPGNVVVNF